MAAPTPSPDETLEFDRPSHVLGGLESTTPTEARMSTGDGDGEGRRIVAGQLIGQYRTLHPLGEGGMGVVWAAEDEVSGRRVALKVMSPALAGNPATVERFIREGQLAAKLSHPRSTFVFDAGEHEGCPYIAMELMPGRTLDDTVRDEGKLSVQRSVDLILDVIDGLQAAHALGIIHRDVKPSNCFIDGDGRAKVGDYGLSKSLVADASLTRTGAFMGTPLFAAPEQVKGAQVDERTDVYAVGATLFYLLAGKGPFDGDAMAVIAKIVSDPPTSLRAARSDAPIALERAVARTLEKDPAKRFQDLGQLRSALLPFASGGTSIAALGRRMAAYMIDSLVAGTLGGVVMIHWQFVEMVGKFMRGEIEPFAATQQSQSQITIFVMTQVISATYFIVGEGRWGCCLGKWAMGLRVTTLEGEPPGFARLALRVLFVPMALGFNAAWPIVALVWFSDEQSQQMMMSFISASVNWVILLLFLTTMRARNGYRGVHDFASGLRVVRWKSGETGEKVDAPIILPSALHSDEKYGPYTPIGDIGVAADGARVVLGEDQTLHRRVWVRVVETTGDSARRAPPPSRPTRPYFLQSGEWKWGVWEAYEAIQGAPLAWIARRPELIEWSVGRRILADLTHELTALRDEGELPESIALDQLWVDRNGKLRVLESPIQLATAIKKDEPFQTPASMAPVALLKYVAKLLTSNKHLSTSVQQFLQELESREETDLFDWANAELATLTAQRDRLRWDDRLVMLGASMGTEFTFYICLSFLLPILVWWTGWPLVVQATLVVSLMSVVAFVMGAAFRGGPIFWLTSVELLDLQGRPAGRLRAGFRYVLCWFGVIFAYGVIAVALGHALGAGQDPRRFAQLARGLLFGIVGGQCLLLLFPLGALYALIRPERGVQDLIAGTRLLPKA